MSISTEVDTSAIWRFTCDVPETFDFVDLFGNDHPVELEVGCGKGLFLVRESARTPQINFLGVEWAKKYARYGVEKLAKSGRTNVRLFTTDVQKMIPHIPDGSIQAVHIYFPDPWWKRRHRKRRVVNPSFVEEIARVLKPGGMLKLATDVHEYFGVMKKVLAGFDMFDLQEVAEPQAPCAPEDVDYLTHFERKYRRQGRPIYRAEYQRR